MIMSMKSMKKSIGYILCGVLIGGVLLNGDATNAAAGLMAERSSQPIFVDGQKVELEAYNIAGSNYVKLRDIGKTVGFNVSWDGSAVQIDSDMPYEDDALQDAAPQFQSISRRVTLPADGSRYVPQVGDLIPCDDGTLYEIKDTLRFENNVYAPGALPDLPEAACDWSRFNSTALPKVEIKRYSDQYGDDLFVRNLYETRRMQYTIYNALGSEPTAWKNGKPLPTVELTIPTEYEAYTAKFWPWRENQITDLVHSRPNSRYFVSAWDYYHDGVYQYCRYCILSL